MAKITSEVAANKVGRYDLILIGARRARELNRGWRPLLDCNNGPVITALREIEAGLVGREYLNKPQNVDRRERPKQEKQDAIIDTRD